MLIGKGNGRKGAVPLASAVASQMVSRAEVARAASGRAADANMGMASSEDAHILDGCFHVFLDVGANVKPYPFP